MHKNQCGSNKENQCGNNRYSIAASRNKIWSNACTRPVYRYQYTYLPQTRVGRFCFFCSSRRRRSQAVAGTCGPWAYIVHSCCCRSATLMFGLGGYARDSLICKRCIQRQHSLSMHKRGSESWGWMRYHWWPLGEMADMMHVTCNNRETAEENLMIPGVRRELIAQYNVLHAIWMRLPSARCGCTELITNI